jgi:hypothetical protein
MSVDSEMVFLNDYSIMDWLRPNSKFYLLEVSGRTVVQDCLGVDLVDVGIGSYRVVATAAKYLADMVRIEKGAKRYGEPDLNKERRELLFIGSVLFYRDAVITKAGLEGHDLVHNGDIKFATTDLETGLDGILFPQGPSIQKVNAILTGYEQQRVDSEIAEMRSRSRTFRSGQRSGRWHERKGY